MWLTFDIATSPAPTETSTGSAVADDLPPFAQLVSDEEREKKAERSNPGTYHVVVNPDSFQHLPEYSDDPDVKRERSFPLRRGSVATSLTSSIGRDSSQAEVVPIPGDPNVVVLPRFEDVLRRTASKDPKSPTSPTLTRIKSEDDDHEAINDKESAEERYLRQFRNVVWKQLVPAELDALDGMERSSSIVMESEASFFLPVSLLVVVVLD